MQSKIDTLHFLNDAPSSSDESCILLDEVDFKWLMAGQGWWIDTTRLHSDPSYAADLLQLAMASHSLVLQKCAALLKEQFGDYRSDTAPVKLVPFD